MSNSDRLLLILHIGFAIFTLGPLTAATMATPRYIRARNVSVLRYLHRATQIYGLATLGIFLFGLFLAKGQFSKVWLTASMTLFIVALVLLLLVARDQRRAVHALQLAEAEAPAAPAAGPATPVAPVAPAEPGAPPAAAEPPVTEPAAEPATGPEPVAARRAAPGGELAEVERGRIAALSGVIALIWLVILFLMVWNGR
jgi:Ca2+/Na+ antiporter